MNVASNRDPWPSTAASAQPFELYSGYEALLATGRVKLLKAAVAAGPAKPRGNRAQRRALERGR